jgi:hypothetical protein
MYIGSNNQPLPREEKKVATRMLERQSVPTILPIAIALMHLCLLTNRAMTKSTDTEQLSQWFPTCKLDSRDSLQFQVAMTTLKSQIKQPSWLIVVAPTCFHRASSRGLRRLIQALMLHRGMTKVKATGVWFA